ncbi:MAG: hypothetical protein ACPG7F_03365 [Aggregatilineales bacterium]
MKRLIGTIHQENGTGYRVNWNSSTHKVWLSKGGLFRNEVIPVGNASSVGEAFAKASDYATE